MSPKDNGSDLAIIWLAFLTLLISSTVIAFWRRNPAGNHLILFADKAICSAVILLLSILSASVLLDFHSDNYSSSIHIHSKLFTSTTSQQFVTAAENHSKTFGWLKKRHRNYPTTDLLVYSLTQNVTVKGPERSDESIDIVVMINRTIETRVYPMLAEKYNIPASHLFMQDLFIVKYDADTPGSQRGLAEHTDSSLLSFNIALSSSADFEGGGTRFALLDKVLKLEIGSIMVHPSRIYHSGIEVSKGKRYIMVGFVQVRDHPWNNVTYWRRFGGKSRCIHVTYTDDSDSWIMTRDDRVCVSGTWVYAYELYVVFRNAFDTNQSFVVGLGTGFTLLMLYIALFITVAILIFMCSSLYGSLKEFPKAD